MINLPLNTGSLLFGFDYGATASLLSRISEFASGVDDDQYHYFVTVANSEGLTALVAAGSSIGATITFCFLIFFGNAISKNDEIVLSALFYFMGALLESVSGEVSWKNLTGLSILITGRLLYGAGIALSFHSVPEYISEISPKIGRGSICSLTEAMAVIGVCLGFLVGYLSSSGNGFIVTFRVGYIIAFVMGILALYLPRSPRSILMNGGCDEDVLKSLQYTRPTATLALVDELKEAFEDAKTVRLNWKKKVASKLEKYGKSRIFARIITALPAELKVLFISRTLRRCLYLALLLVFLQQFCGQGAILYYSGTIFGILCPTNTSDCIIGFGLVKLLFVLIMVFFADSYGRRRFLIVGSSFMTFGLVMLCIGFSYQVYPLAIFGIYLSVAANEISLATLLWVVLCEIFPQFVRSAAISIAVATLFICATIVVLMLPYISKSVGLLAVFLMYTVTGGLSVLLLYLFVPETRGIDLEVSYKLVNIRIEKSLQCCSTKVVDGDQSDDVMPSLTNISSDSDRGDGEEEGESPFRESDPNKRINLL